MFGFYWMWEMNLTQKVSSKHLNPISLTFVTVRYRNLKRF